MTYFSVCSGIEATSVAWEPLGWQAVGFSEIEPFPCEVLRQRFPSVKNYGDMTAFREWKNVGKFRVLVGGTPCQSFSIAGLRRGLNDERGNLMLAYGSLASYYKPQWIVWENVPGVLSSHRGRDFGTFLAMLAQCGYGFAYRILDAKYFGVPQQRRRVFVVGYRGDWRRAAAVLFDEASLCGNFAPSKKKKQATPAKAKRSTESTVYLAHSMDGRYKEADGIADTVTAHYGTGGGNIPLVMDSFFCCTKNMSGALKATNHKDKPILFYPNRILRRLTPVECERLQGLPDNWTRISWRGKPEKECPDSLRYKAIGNSMAVPVMRWIGERIQKFDIYGVEKKRLPRKTVDYDRLYELLKAGPVTFEQIRQETGLDRSGASQVVTTLSLKYPVYNLKRGVYALLQ